MPPSDPSRRRERIDDVTSTADLPHVLRRLMSAGNWRPLQGGYGLRVAGADLLVCGAARCTNTGGLGVFACAWVSGFAAGALVVHAPLKVTAGMNKREWVAMDALHGTRTTYGAACARLQRLLAPILLQTPEFMRALLDSAVDGYIRHAADATATRVDDWREALAPLRECTIRISWEPLPWSRT